MTGNVTFNLARVEGVGLFEMSFGKDGLSSRLGMGGTDISLGTIGAAMRGVSFDSSGSKLTGVVGGATIGTVGSSGKSTAAHLHWRLWDVNDSKSSSYPTAHDPYASYLATMKYKNSAVYRESGYANNATSEDVYRRYTESLRLENLGIQYARPRTSISNHDAYWDFVLEYGIYE